VRYEIVVQQTRGGALVDRLGETLGGDRPVGVGTHVHHLGAAKLLRVAI